MTRPDPDPLSTFEQFCHEFGNPLMIISGQAFLVHRRVERLPHLPGDERAALLSGLAEMAQMVTIMAVQLECYHAAVADERNIPDAWEDGPVVLQERGHERGTVQYHETE